MARYDASTAAFIEKIAGSVAHLKPKEPEPAEALPAHGSATKDALKATKKILQAAKDPKGALPRMAVALATKELLKEGTTPVLRIYGLLNEHYKELWWDWEPETIWQTLTTDHAVDPEPELKNIIMALQLTARSNAPFEHWHIFEKVGHAFNGNPVDFNVLQPLELHEAALTVFILDTIRPAQAFDDEVLGYIGGVAKFSGIVFLPAAWFDNAQKYLDELVNDLELRDAVRTRWVDAGERHVPEPRPDDSPAMKIQLLSLREVEDYIKEHA
jgi:hypothetical protein